MDRDSAHAVEAGQEAWHFHKAPCPLARQIEARVGRGLALRVIGGEPLGNGELEK